MVAIPQTPIVNAPNRYVNGLAISNFNSTILNVSNGAARDSTNTNDIIMNTLDTSVFLGRNGLNGLDTGTVAANLFYAVHIIGDSTDYNAPGFLLSLSAINPILPDGYDMFRRIGWMRTDGSANNLRMWEYGDGLFRTYYYDVPPTILTAGNATIFSAGFIDLSALVAVPNFSIISDECDPLISINISFTANSAVNVAEFAVANAATVPIARFGTGVAATQVGNITIPTLLTTATSFRYRVTSASDALTLTLASFTDHLSFG